MSSKQNLWIQKKKKIILLIAAVMAVVLVVSFISFFKIEEENKEEEFKPYESMYNASRYFFVSKSLDTQMDFDLGLAVKNSNDNPVYYIEYANARISSILNNYQGSILPKEKYNTLEEDIAYNIMNKLIRFEDTIISSVTKLILELP